MYSLKPRRPSIPERMPPLRVANGRILGRIAMFSTEASHGYGQSRLEETSAKSNVLTVGNHLSVTIGAYRNAVAIINEGFGPARVFRPSSERVVVFWGAIFPFL